MITAVMAEAILAAVKGADAEALAEALAEAVYACTEDDDDDEEEDGPGILIGVARKKK
uniref:Uncharacterized protein n=1 Tax=viral metagenome TaxID=1070528 RepID=A0A6M3J5V0_9ZZZZ